MISHDLVGNRKSQPCAAHIPFGRIKRILDAFDRFVRHSDALIVNFYENGIPDGIIARALRLARDMKKSIIVQPGMSNHLDLARFCISNGALVCLRAMTGRLPDAMPRYLPTSAFPRRSASVGTWP